MKVLYLKIVSDGIDKNRIAHRVVLGLY